jgi:hypothetical protein
LQGPGGAAKGNAYYDVMGVKRHGRYSMHIVDDGVGFVTAAPTGAACDCAAPTSVRHTGGDVRAESRAGHGTNLLIPLAGTPAELAHA